MAEDPEIRALMKRMKAELTFHANELAGLFCRELFEAPADDVWVLFMRSLRFGHRAVRDRGARSSQTGRSRRHAVVVQAGRAAHDRYYFSG